MYIEDYFTDVLIEEDFEYVRDPYPSVFFKKGDVKWVSFIGSILVISDPVLGDTYTSFQDLVDKGCKVSKTRRPRK